MYIYMYAVTLGSARAYGGKYEGLGCIGDREMAGLERDDSKRRHSFCQIGIAHGARPKLGLGQLQLWLQVSIWDMGQG